MREIRIAQIAKVARLPVLFIIIVVDLGKVGWEIFASVDTC
jgi:hypothetical protein